MDGKKLDELIGTLQSQVDVLIMFMAGKIPTTFGERTRKHWKTRLLYSQKELLDLKGLKQ